MNVKREKTYVLRWGEDGLAGRKTALKKEEEEHGGVGRRKGPIVVTGR